MSAAIEIAGLVRRYGAATALDGIDLRVEAGAYCVLLGPSGCGKTTLLNILGGFADADGGTVRIGGRDMAGVPAARRPTATVFQDYALFPHMSLIDNVGFGLRMRGVPRRERHARAKAMLALVGLEGEGARRPAALSGGQRQRVALARALAPEPEVLLLDEPLGALDLNLRRAMQQELKHIQARVGATFVHVTHDQEEAMALADQVVVMNAGRIEDAGPPGRVYRRPASRFAASFMGEINLLSGRTGPPDGARLMVGTAIGPLPVRVDGPALPTSVAVKIGIRPEAFRAPAGDGAIRVPATVTETTFFGTHHRVLAAASPGGTPLIAHLPPEADPRPGGRVILTLDPAELILLPDPRDLKRRTAP